MTKTIFKSFVTNLAIGFLTLFIIISCNKKNEVQKIDPNKLQPSEIVWDTLSKQQIEKIKKIHFIFKEVDNSNLEQTITDFKRDANPDNEIEIWLKMAETYQMYLSKNKKNIEEKKEVFKLILSRSMMNAEDAISNSNLKYLTRKDAEEVLSFYNDDPKPITVQ